jgi:hypothetical protein
MTDNVCPHCGTEINYYFEDVEPGDWVVIEPHTHDPQEYECERGCTEISEITYDLICRECDGEIEVYCRWAQPCNANGYELALEMTKPRVGGTKDG